MELPSTYVIDKFNTYSSKVRETRQYLNGCCPVCREGNSWNIKRRLFYFLEDEYLYCHNCNRSWFPISWVMEVCNMSYKEVVKELKENNYDVDFELVVDENKPTFDLPTLPGECVNLKDELQIKYFSHYPIVKQTLDYCRERRLFTALNSPKTFYCCLNDKFHGNRLIIPFYGENHKIISYISRKILTTDYKAKYMMKFGSNKPIFNIQNVDENYPYIFICEGQIDAMFIKNGIAISGAYLTNEQEQELIQKFPFHQQIWILDNYRFEEKEIVKIIIDKLKSNKQVFLYNDDFSEFKDLNEYCVKKEQDFVDPALVLKSCFSGSKGLLQIE